MMAYMDNRQTFSRRARRVVPAYADLLSDYLGMAQVVLAFLIVVIAVIGFAIKSFTSAAVAGLLLAAPLFVCGVFGVLAGVRKEIWAIIGYLILSIISLCLCVVVLGSAVVGIAMEYERQSSVSVAVREGIDISLVAFSLLSGASATLSMVISGAHVLKGCCKCVEGVKYVEEPNVQFSSTPGLDMPSNNSESAGYDQSTDKDIAIHISTVPEIPGPQPNPHFKAGNGQYFQNPLADSSIS